MLVSGMQRQKDRHHKFKATLVYLRGPAEPEPPREILSKICNNNHFTESSGGHWEGGSTEVTVRGIYTRSRWPGWKPNHQAVEDSMALV